jgi:hypothetical protein
MAQSSYKIPQRGGIKQVSITFYDDINSTLMRWFRDWVEIDIKNKGKFISCINDDHSLASINAVDSFGNSTRNVTPVRAVRIEQLNASLQPTGLTYELKVYPEGDLNFSGGSTSEVNAYTINFVIVGDKTEQSKGRAKKDILANESIKLLGRFV